MNECPKCKGNKTFPYNGTDGTERMCTGCGRVFRPEALAPSGKENSYYWVELPIECVTIDKLNGSVGFMIEEYIKHGLGNDFDRGNIAKANHRIGKKPGNSEKYDIDKIKYYAGRMEKD